MAAVRTLSNIHSQWNFKRDLTKSHRPRAEVFSLHTICLVCKHKPHFSTLAGVPHQYTVICRSTGSATFQAPGDHQSDILHSEVAARARGFLFYLWTFTLAIPLFVIMVVQAPIVALVDKHRRLTQHFVSNIWAKLTTRLFFRVHVQNRELLPPANQPVVYVANHQSFLDIYTLFHLSRPFKFISKTSIFLIPIIGWSMFLTGHVRLNRMDRKSQLACLSACKAYLQKGASVLFFPEGTRATDMCLQEFKKGAFSVAAKAKVPVVPITLIGTGLKMPNKQEEKLFPGKVQIIVHPPVQPASADEMMRKARNAIVSALPPELHSQPQAV